MFSEYFLDSFHFRDVSHGSRSTVYVDVIYFFRLHACIFQCVSHHELGSQAFGVGSCEVVSIGRHSYAGYFCIYFSAACLGVFQFFENQTAAAFTHYETVAACAEGT